MEKKVRGEKVSVKCLAVEDGYHQGKVIKAGEVFVFNGHLNKGKLPLWVEAKEKFEIPKAKKEVAKKEEKEVKEVQKEIPSLVDIY
jgi:hypothetical protein